MSLTKKHCVPCEGGTKPLGSGDIEKYHSLLQNDWQVVDGLKINQTFSFKNFKEALAFVNTVGAIAEAEGHHPDIELHDFKKVTIRLWTHAINGLSENDFIMAAKIEQKYLTDKKE